MKQTKACQLASEAGICKAPAYPHRPDKIVLALKQALDAVERAPGHRLTQVEFGQLCGVGRSTINYWLCTEYARQICNFLSGLERLPEAERLQFLRKACRDCPRLTHPRLAHDPKGIALMKALLKQPAGLSFVTAPSSQLRTFLLIALGNSAGQVDPEKSVCGLDLHEPAMFSPVPGVLYLQKRPGIEDYRRQVLQLWPIIENSAADLILLNGIWSLAPDIRPRIQKIARKKHVIIADQLDADTFRQIVRRHSTAKVVRASHQKTHPDWIQIRAGFGQIR